MHIYIFIFRHLSSSRQPPSGRSIDVFASTATTHTRVQLTIVVEEMRGVDAKRLAQHTRHGVSARGGGGDARLIVGVGTERQRRHLKNGETTSVAISILISSYR